MVFAFAFPVILFFTYRKAVNRENILFKIQEKAQVILTYNLKYEDFDKQQYIYHSQAFRDFIESYGILLKDIDIARTGPNVAVLTPIVDLVTQLCLAVAVTRLINWPIFQIFLFNFILQGYLVFFVYFSPYKQKSKQFWTIFDKLVLLGLNYHMMLFTDFVVDSERYDQIANSVIYIVSGCSLLRLCFELTVTTQALIQSAKQAYINYLVKKPNYNTQTKGQQKCLNLIQHSINYI